LAARDAGLEIARVTVGVDGSITIDAGKPQAPMDDLDRELADFEARHEG
jgi:hypothetical protein